MNRSKNTRIPLEEFLRSSKEYPILDVRTPSEFAHAHIPGAINLPIFTDQERAEVGTFYKQVSREKPLKRGSTFWTQIEYIS